mgnify:FL=1
MHPHHKLALDKARSDFRKARTLMNLEVKRLRLAREFAVARDKTDHYHRHWLRGMIQSALRAIEDYQAQGEVLVCVERMLEKA